MIKDFNYYAPTRVVFGRESEKELVQLILHEEAEKVLVVYGGQSAKRSGLLDRTLESLDHYGIAHWELGGVVPNPLLSKVKEGVDICRMNMIQLVLAIGGGSVIDTAKAIGMLFSYPWDPWDFWNKGGSPKDCLPIGVILTIPAAGSEMSSSCVITRDEDKQKRGLNSDLCRPRFCIMNPELTYTLPPYQTAAGATDIMMHTMERYFSKYEDMTLTDGLAESLLRTVKDCVFEVLKDPCDYRNRSQIMWASSLAHNDLTECGLEKDFATHRLEHELSAVYDVTHGAGLAAIWGSWARYVLPKHVNRFARFAVNVMGINNDFANPEQTALKGIEAMERFYHDIGMPTSIKELLGRDLTDDELAALADRCSRNGTITVGAMEVLRREDMLKIYEMAR